MREIKDIDFNELITLTVEEEDSALRADKFLSQCLSGYSRSFAQRLFEDGLVNINGKAISKSRKLSPGEELSFIVPEPKRLSLLPENIPLEIVYEDEELLVVNKPKGMVVHPAPGNYDGTLVNALLYHCGDRLSGINGVIRPGIVHRIDRDTSGILVVAKTDEAHFSLSQQIKAHTVSREYQAVAHGHLKEGEGIIDLPIGRSEKDRKKMCVTDKNSKNAVTHYEVIKEYPGYSHIICRLETGRTHQIRVHMAHIGHPLAGDTVYGYKDRNLFLLGQCLNAGLLAFDHPKTGERMKFCVPLPEYFEKFLSVLE